MRKFLLPRVLFSPAVGCMQFKPVGILNDAPPPTTKASKTNPNARIALDPEAVPPLKEAPPPPAPANLVGPGEIDTKNYKEAVRKLAEEIDQDRKATDQFPNYSTVSKIERK